MKIFNILVLKYIFNILRTNFHKTKNFFTQRNYHNFLRKLFKICKFLIDIIKKNAFMTKLIILQNENFKIKKIFKNYLSRCFTFQKFMFIFYRLESLFIRSATKINYYY